MPWPVSFQWSGDQPSPTLSPFQVIHPRWLSAVRLHERRSDHSWALEEDPGELPTGWYSQQWNGIREALGEIWSGQRRLRPQPSLPPVIGLWRQSGRRDRCEHSTVSLAFQRCPVDGSTHVVVVVDRGKQSFLVQAKTTSEISWNDDWIEWAWRWPSIETPGTSSQCSRRTAPRNVVERTELDQRTEHEVPQSRSKSPENGETVAWKRWIPSLSGSKGKAVCGAGNWRRAFCVFQVNEGYFCLKTVFQYLDPTQTHSITKHQLIAALNQFDISIHMRNVDPFLKRWESLWFARRWWIVVVLGTISADRDRTRMTSRSITTPFSSIFRIVRTRVFSPVHWVPSARTSKCPGNVLWSAPMVSLVRLKIERRTTPVQYNRKRNYRSTASSISLADCCFQVSAVWLHRIEPRLSLRRFISSDLDDLCPEEELFLILRKELGLADSYQFPGKQKNEVYHLLNCQDQLKKKRQLPYKRLLHFLSKTFVETSMPIEKPCNSSAVFLEPFRYPKNAASRRKKSLP